MKPPTTYFEWSELLDLFNEGDDTVVNILHQGSFSANSGTETRFCKLITDAYNHRISKWLENFNKSFHELKSESDYRLLIKNSKTDLNSLIQFTKIPCFPKNLKDTLSENLDKVIIETKESLQKECMKLTDNRENLLSAINNFSIPDTLKDEISSQSIANTVHENVQKKIITENIKQQTQQNNVKTEPDGKTLHAEIKLNSIVGETEDGSGKNDTLQFSSAKKVADEKDNIANEKQDNLKSAISEKIICPVCKTEYNEIIKFCNECGTFLNVPQQNTSTPADVIYNLAIEFMQKKKYNEALNCLSKAIAVKPEIKIYKEKSENIKQIIIKRKKRFRLLILLSSILGSLLIVSLFYLFIYKKYFVQTLQIRLSQNIALSQEDTLWQLTLSKNSITAYDEFIQWCNIKGNAQKYILPAKQKIEELTWCDALKSNTLVGFNKFIKDYPASINIEN
ncbi:MAG: tetratricopeptide repeat protein, partial [Bacteroidia bacterium]|nr:tetratricopeptide repeat protein [Bacteroidia bacterium]